MSFTSNLWARFSVWSGPRTTFRKHKRFASLVILLALLALSLGCGLIGGGAVEEMTAVLADEGETTEAEADQGETAEAGTETEAEGQPEPGAAAETQTETEPAAEEEPTAAAADPVLVPDPQLPRDLTWAHLSQCVTLKPIELEATLINSDWFVTGSAEATRAYGFWKVDAITGTVTPYDTHSRQWQAAVDAQCSPESLQAIVLPAGPQAPVVGDADSAVSTVWSFLTRCFSNLDMDIFEATRVTARGEWVVVTKPNSGREFGTWKVSEATGELEPYAGLAQAWDSTVKLECSAEAMAALVTPAPVPTPTPAVEEITEAVRNLWAYLVKCAPELTVEGLVATWNPVSDEWIVVTKPGGAVDYGVWTLKKDGSMIPDNREAARRNVEVGLETC